MEQKRILWITAAVGIFLLVVLGGALIIYSPQTRAPKSIAKSASVTESNGWVSIAPVEKSAETERQIVDLNAEISENPLVSDSTENQNIPEVVSSFNANNLGVNMSEQEGQIAKTGDVTVYVENATVISAKDFSEKSEKTLQPSENVQVESKIVPEKKEVVERKVVAKSNPVQEKKVLLPKKSESVSKAPVKSVSEKKTVSETRKSTQDWIQVASLTIRKNADSARAVLGENKITADVFTYKDTSDKLYYRVRVGPYTTKSEAEYWRGEIAKIDSFASSQSYVTSTVVE